MSGMEPLMIGAAVGGSVLQAVGSVQAGREQARAAQFEKKQLEIQEQQTNTAAAQAEANRRSELTSSLETIQALRAGRNVGSASPTGLAILDNVINEAQQNIVTERSNYRTKASLSAQAAQLSERKAKTSLLAGYLGGAEALTSGAVRAYGIGSGRYPVATARV